MSSDKNQYAAAASALGYNYQQRYALYWLFSSPEEAECQIECDDDIDLTVEGVQKLASLKHKASGDKLTDLSLDFWKSVRIWLHRFKVNPKPTNKARFVLFTTSSVSSDSLLTAFLPSENLAETDRDELMKKIAVSKSEIILAVSADLNSLSPAERKDFFNRITIFDAEPRIEDIPQKIQNSYFRTVPTQYRADVYQRLEGWWFDLTIKMMAGERKTPLTGMEVSEMLSYFSDQYREDNLPVKYEYAEPEQEPDSDNDQRNFVQQLRTIGISSDRINRAIRDYYRATEQRGEWIRVDLKLDGELERYDDRLVEEWGRQREIIWEAVSDTTPEEELQSLGKKVLNELLTNDSDRLRIRPRVTATFVVAGSYHILANEAEPKVHWHPRFRERVAEIFCEGGDR